MINSGNNSLKFIDSKLPRYYLYVLLKLNCTLIFSQQLFLKLFIFIFFKRRKRFIEKEKENILTFKTGGLGDFLFGLPAFNVLRRERPHAKFTLLTFIALSGVHLKNLKKRGLSELPWVKLTSDYFNDIIELKGISLADILSLRKSFKDKNFTTIIYMSAPGEPFISILKKLLFLLILGGRKSSIYGWNQNYSTAYFRKYHADWRLAQHKIKGPLRAVEHFLNYEVQIVDSDLKLKESMQYTSARRSLGLESIMDGNDSYIVICPGSSFDWKNWGSYKYKELCERLSPILKDKKIQVLMVGPKSDRELADSILRGLSGRNICGDFTIPEYSLIFRHSKCVITTDGGLAHLAAFSNAKLVSISNSNEEPGVVTPVGNNVIELRNFISCAPCFGMDHCPQEHAKCVKDIEVSSVCREVENILIKES